MTNAPLQNLGCCGVTRTRTSDVPKKALIQIACVADVVATISALENIHVPDREMMPFDSLRAFDAFALLTLARR